MEVGQRLGGLVGDPQASVQRNVLPVVTVDEIKQRAVGDELVDEHGDLDLEAAAEELDDVPVVDLGQDEHLLAELFLLLLVDRHAPLHGDLGAALLQDSLVDGPVAAVAEHSLRVEAGRGLLQLFFGEDGERGGARLVVL
jgi:hypothetical protein